MRIIFATLFTSIFLSLLYVEELFGDPTRFGVAARLAFSSADNKFEIYVVEGALGIDIDDIREADLRNWEVSLLALAEQMSPLKIS